MERLLSAGTHLIAQTGAAQALTCRYKPGLRTATGHAQDDSNTVFSSLFEVSEALPRPPSSSELLPSPTSTAKVSELSQGNCYPEFFFLLVFQQVPVPVPLVAGGWDPHGSTLQM